MCKYTDFNLDIKEIFFIFLVFFKKGFYLYQSTPKCVSWKQILIMQVFVHKYIHNLALGSDEAEISVDWLHLAEFCESRFVPLIPMVAFFFKEGCKNPASWKTAEDSCKTILHFLQWLRHPNKYKRKYGAYT